MSAVVHELVGLPSGDEQLRGHIRDLVSLAALSSGWIDGDPASIADQLASSLQVALGASFVYVQVRPSSHGSVVEALHSGADPRGKASPKMMDRLRVLALTSDNGPPLLVEEVDDNGTKIIVNPIGSRGECGTVIAGSNVPGFPSYSGKLFLNLAVTQTYLSLQARQLHEKERAARIQAEMAQERITRVLESITDAFIAVDSDWKVVHLNAEGERLMRKTRVELIGRNLWTEFPEAVTPSLQFFDVMTKALQEQRRVDFEEFYPPYDVWIEVHLYPSAEGASIYFRDITERKRSEESVRLSEARFRQLADSMPQIVWTAEPDGNIDYLNQRWYQYTGSPGGEHWKDSFLAVAYPGDDVRALDKWQEALESGEPYEVQCRLRERRTGSYRWHLVRAVPVRDDAGTIVRWLGTSTDVNSGKQTEEELEAAKIAAESASRAKGAFLARMSHELRTPLNSVIGFADVLRKNKAGNLSSGDLSNLERISANGRHLLQVINDVLDHSKVESGRMDVDWGMISLRQLILEVTGQLSGGPLNARGVALRMDLPDNIASVETDRGKLKQVLINLVANALKFTERGSVTVRAAIDEATGAPVRIDVIDTGIGIPINRQQAIFDPFEQVDRHTSLQYGGTGLGLSISRSYCQLMGYALTVESEPGRGSVFSILLNAKNASPS